MLFTVLSSCYTDKCGRPSITDPEILHTARVSVFTVALDLIVALGILALAIYGFATEGQQAISLLAAKISIGIGSVYTFIALIFTAFVLCKKEQFLGNRTYCRAAWTGKVGRT